MANASQCRAALARGLRRSGPRFVLPRGSAIAIRRPVAMLGFPAAAVREPCPEATRSGGDGAREVEDRDRAGATHDPPRACGWPKRIDAGCGWSALLTGLKSRRGAAGTAARPRNRMPAWPAVGAHTALPGARLPADPSVMSTDRSPGGQDWHPLSSGTVQGSPAGRNSAADSGIAMESGTHETAIAIARAVVSCCGRRRSRLPNIMFRLLPVSNGLPPHLDPHLRRRWNCRVHFR